MPGVDESEVLLAPECTLERMGRGRYERVATRTWWGHGCLHGGYVLALAMTAVTAELGREGMELHQLSMHYLRPLFDGPLEVRVDVLRSGRRLASATVTMESAGQLAAVGLASVAAPGEAKATVLAPPPRVEAYDSAHNDPDAPARGLQIRSWIQPREPEAPSPGPRLVAWVAPRGPEPIDHRWVGVVTDLLVPPAAAVWDVWPGLQTVDLTYHARTRLPRADLPPGSPLLVSVRSQAAAGGFLDEDVEVWDASGALLAQSRQMRLVSGRPASS